MIYSMFQQVSVALQMVLSTYLFLQNYAILLIYPRFFRNFVGVFNFEHLYQTIKQKQMVNHICLSIVSRVAAVLLLLAVTAVQPLVAQTTKWREMHKVKKKETIFGIAQKYGLTSAELMDANPEMKVEGYSLKKGDYIFIPFAKAPVATTPPVSKATAAEVDDLRHRAIRVGVLLPLHNINGDGRRMVEYYRGVLMACDSLKAEGISVDVRAWNVAEDADITKTLKDRKAAQCDLFIGPLYSKQVAPLAHFAREHNAKVLIPFSITAPEVNSNPCLYQVYQDGSEFNEAVINRYVEKFSGCHTVLIDCNDTTSRKGVFTFGLRKKLEGMGQTYSITNLKSSEAMFAKAFSRTMPNVVVLNTGRSPELNVALAKLNSLTTGNSQLDITLFGYTEWMMYTKFNLDNFYKYNVYIPAAFHTNPLSSRTARITQKYRWNFHADMMQALPRFAITGFDHTYFFLKGMHLYGHNFTGAPGTVGYTPIQTPLKFERVAPGGGWKNRSVLLVHYMPSHRVETLAN